ncbi:MULTISPECIES: hypothetical protein [Halolamina]|nr:MULTISPECIES: hypothetical protein [Halolamina]NHX37613.1 hypothetical protein [Halolamina sp. R1-12]
MVGQIFLKRGHIGFLAGLATTSMGLSSGFIWASNGQAVLVVIAAIAAWTGYLGAHYAVTGRFLDGDTRQKEGIGGREALHLDAGWQYLAVGIGVSILISGMVIGAVYINRGNHLATNIGGVLFLGGYVIAHYGATKELL